MVQVAAGSLLFTRSHVMVSNTWHSSPCQRGPALARASGHMPVMSSAVAGRTTDSPSSWWKRSENEHMSNSGVFPQESGVWAALVLVTFPSPMRPCSQRCSRLPCTEGRAAGRHGAGVHRWSPMKSLTPWALRSGDLSLNRVVKGQILFKKRKIGVLGWLCRSSISPWFRS